MSSTHTSDPRLIEHTTPLDRSGDAMVIEALNARICAKDTEIAAPKLSLQTGQDKLGEVKLGWEKVIHSQAKVIREQAGRIYDLEEGLAGKDAELKDTAKELKEHQEDALDLADGYQEAMLRVAVLAAENQALKGKLKDSESGGQVEKMQSR